MAVNKIKGLTVEVDGDIVPFQKALRRVNAEVNESNQALKNLNTGLKLDPNNADLLANKQKVLSKAISESEEALKKFQKIQKELDSRNVDKTSKEYTDLQKQIVQTNDAIKKFSAQLQKIPFESTIRGSEELSRSFQQIYDATKRISQLSVAGLFGLTFNAAQYESDIAGIQKVVRDLRDETVDDLKDISIATSSSFSSIAEYATIAAALGVGQEDLAAFAQTMKDLETVTDGSIVGEDGAKMVARFLNVMNIGTDEVHNFGSALTIVEDKLAVTADEVLEISSRLGALSAVGNVTQHDIIGLGGVMMNLGLRVESSASAITRVFLDIENQVATASDKMVEYAQVAGMTGDEFAKMWDTNPMEAFIAFTDGLKSSVFREMGEAVRGDTEALEGFASVLGLTTDQFKNLYSENPQDAFEAYVNALSELEDTGESTSVILDRLGLSGVRTAETLLKLAGNGELIREMIQTSNDAWEENTELTEKAGVIYETTQKQLEATWEAIKQAAESIGKTLLPTVKEVAEFVRDLAQGFSELPDSVKNGIVNLLLFGSAIAPIAKVGEKFFKITGDVTKGIASIGQTADKNAPLLTKFVRTLGTALGFNPAKLASLGPTLATLGTAGAFLATTLGIYLTYQTEAQKATDALRDSTDDLNISLEEQIQLGRDNYAQTLYNIAGGYKQIDEINELIAKRQEMIAQGEDVAEITSQINEGLSEINQIAGSSYYFDPETSGLYDEKGAVDDLKSSYSELIEQQKISAWLTANASAYEQASTNMQTAIDNQVTALRENREEVEGLGDDYAALFDKLLNGEKISSQDLLPLDPETVNHVYGLYRDLMAAIDESNATISENNAFKTAYEDIMNLDSEEALGVIDKLQNGLYIPESTMENWDLLNADLAETNRQIEEFEALRQAGTSIPQETLDNLYARKEELQRQINDLQAQMETSKEILLSDSQEGAANAMVAIGETFTKGADENVKKPIVSSVEEGLDEATKIINIWELPTKTLPVNIVYNDPGYQGARTIYSMPNTQSLDNEPRMARAVMPLNDEPSYTPRVATIQPMDVSSQMRSVIDSMNATLARSEQNFDLDTLVSKALKNIVIEVNVNNDMDGRQIASQVSTIQGLKIKKQNS